MMENTAYLYPLPHIIGMVIWAANVTYTIEKRKVLVSESERNRPFGIPRCR
jgi:hypothetical protein